MSIVFECRDFEGRRVILWLNSWRHILAKRPWVYEHRAKIIEAVEKPDMVLEGKLGELLAVKWFKGLLDGVYLVVVYRTLNGEGFIITAYPTKKMERLRNRRRLVWKRP
ncbi:MAG: hypothetical protein QXN23_03795 [Candidatus Caldarchaeum sp.]|jgi:hypothetical protein|uniref:Uncharacterized protein n=1 Tax=Caldiarchaeum subterraneum TaxID=311458 RepID=A0A7C4E160_CALS0|nr:hypothetical protein [Candidatus Caldarchaeales archaeon]MDJ0272539.1 hypothetical protein [Candidatus Caldarchaeales archaeon]